MLTSSSSQPIVDDISNLKSRKNVSAAAGLCKNTFCMLLTTPRFGLKVITIYKQFLSINLRNRNKRGLWLSRSQSWVTFLFNILLINCIIIKSSHFENSLGRANMDDAMYCLAKDSVDYYVYGNTDEEGEWANLLLPLNSNNLIAALLIKFMYFFLTKHKLLFILDYELNFIFHFLINASH